MHQGKMTSEVLNKQRLGNQEQDIDYNHAQN